MSFYTPATQTELEAINQMLAAVGQAPVTSIDLDQNDDPTNPDVAMARETLRQVSREVQAEGWTFNRELDFPLKTNQDDEIVLTPTMLQVDLNQSYVNNRGRESIRREGKLYDKKNHTYKWYPDTVYCDILWLFEWEDLPAPVVDYIVSKASAKYSQRVVGDPNLYKELVTQAAECRAYALEYETQQGDYTFFGQPKSGNYYISYQPYTALQR